MIETYTKTKENFEEMVIKYPDGTEINFSKKYGDLFLLNPQIFLGFPIGQTLTFSFVINKFLIEHPEITKIIELGTWHGATSIIFGLSMLNRNGKVITYDLVPPSDKWFNTIKGLPIIFKQKDIFKEETKTEIANAIKGETALIFCDAGMAYTLKSKELREYCFVAKPGDYVLSHDWGTEVKLEHLLEKNYEGTEYPEGINSIFDFMEPHQQEFFDDYNSLILSLKKKQTNNRFIL